MPDRVCPDVQPRAYCEPQPTRAPPARPAARRTGTEMRGPR
jgi:hypothetical protein